MAWENDDYVLNVAGAEELINPAQPRGWRGNVAALAAAAKNPLSQLHQGKLPVNMEREILKALTGARKLPGNDPLTRLRKNYRFALARNLPNAVSNMVTQRARRLVQRNLLRQVAEEATQWPQIRAAREAARLAALEEARRIKFEQNLANAEETIAARNYLQKRAALNALATSRRRRGKGANVYNYPYNNITSESWALAREALPFNKFAGITRENRLAASRYGREYAKDRKKLHRFGKTLSKKNKKALKKTLKNAKTTLKKLEAIVENVENNKSYNLNNSNNNNNNNND